MNKEIPSSRMGMEDPEAAAEEYREKVTQSKNSARRVVNAKEPAPGRFLPKGRKRAKGWPQHGGKGVVPRGRGGSAGWEIQAGAAGGIARWQKEPLEISNLNWGCSTEGTPARHCPVGCFSMSSLLEVTCSTPRSFCSSLGDAKWGYDYTDEHPTLDWQEDKIGLRRKGSRGDEEGYEKGESGRPWAKFRKKTVATGSQRTGIPTQSIPKYSKRALVTEASRESGKLGPLWDWKARKEAKSRGSKRQCLRSRRQRKTRLDASRRR